MPDRPFNDYRKFAERGALFPPPTPVTEAIKGYLSVGCGVTQVGRLHSELFVGRGDIPPIDIRWLEDSQYHALPLNSPVRSVLADRENIYVSTGLDVHRHGVNQFPSHDGSIKGSIAQLRNTCLETASHICATVHQEVSSRPIARPTSHKLPALTFGCLTRNGEKRCWKRAGYLS